ncbi:MAG: YgiT-type zinc finger protein [Acidobacteriota bacterium]
MKRKKRARDVECALCGQRTARVVLTPKVFGRGARRVLIENIPVYHCRNCHSQYVDGRTMDAIDEIRKNPSAWSRKETIATAALAA